MKWGRQRSAAAGSAPCRHGRAAGPGTRGWGGEGKGERGTGGHRHLPPQPCSHPPTAAPQPCSHPPTAAPQPCPHPPSAACPRPRAPIGCRPFSGSQSEGSCQALPSIFSTHKQTRSDTRALCRTRAFCVSRGRAFCVGHACSVSDTRALCLSGARARRGGAWAGCGKAAPRPRCRAPPLREERGEPDPDPTAPGSSEGNWGTTGEKCCVKQINK